MRPPYRITQELDIPANAFDKDGIATIIVNGAFYGGSWLLNADSPNTPPGQVRALIRAFGAMETLNCACERRDLAIKTAGDWLREECKRLGYKIKKTEDQNDSLSSPFAVRALFLIDRRK